MKLTAIINPVTTEKSSQAQEKGIYTFIVRKEATKIDVKHAVETMYGEKVEKVQMTMVKAKARPIARGKFFQKRPSLKKAIVKLKGGKKIDPYKFEKPKK